jgi:hypothetical protein
MTYSKFYKRNPAGDLLIDRARDFARRNPARDSTHRFLRELIHNADLAAVYSEVPNRGNFHSEVGRQVRAELEADVFQGPDGRTRRIRIKGGPHKSYTPLHLPRQR